MLVFWKATFDKSAHQDPHFVSLSNGLFSRHNSAWRPQGGTLICSSYVGSGPASTVHPSKKYQEFQAPQKIFFIPPKILIFLKTKNK